MKKISIFLLITGIILIFSSCMTNHAKTTIKVNLKGADIISVSREALEESWDYLIFELKDSSNNIVEHIEKSRTDFINYGLEFTKDNFSGEFNAFVILKKNGDSGAYDVASGTTTKTFAEGLNELTINIGLLPGRLMFAPANYDNIIYSYKLSLYNNKNEKYDIEENLSQDASPVYDNVPAGTYHLFVTINEGDKIVWANDGNNGFSYAPFLVDIHPNLLTEVVFDPLSKGKISMNFPYESKPYDLTAVQENYNKKVVLSWKYNNHDNNVTYYIFKKIPGAVNYTLLTSISAPFTGLSVNDSTFSWTDENNKQLGNITYSINIVKNYDGSNKESGSVPFEPVNVLPILNAPDFSKESGTYENPITLELSSSESDASIYYTDDGSTPTTDSTYYSTTIELSTSKTIKAITVKDGFKTSMPAVKTYSIYSGNLPGNIGSNVEEAVYHSIFAPDSNNIHYVAYDDDSYSIRVKAYNK